MGDISFLTPYSITNFIFEQDIILSLEFRTLLPYFYFKSHEQSQNSIQSDTKERSKPIEQKLAQARWEAELSSDSLFSFNGFLLPSR